MSARLWGHRPPPTAGPGAAVAWAWELRTAADVTAARTELREEVSPAAADDDVQRLLLSFEELASNGMRHGDAPVRARVVTTPAGWLIDVSDTAVQRPPAPAIGRDAADGGLGLYLVARLAAAHGWSVRGARKHVWAQVDRAPAGRRSALRPGRQGRPGGGRG